MIINRRAVDEYLDRELASYLWMKELRRRELLEEIRSFRVKPQFKTDPWLHQLVCFMIGACEPRWLFLLDMGLGKSKILADLITQAQREKRLRRALVLVPNVVNMDSWSDDLQRHSDLEPWLCNNEDTHDKWERLSDPEGDVTIINYQGLQLAVCDKKKGKLVPNVKRIARVQRLYNFVGIDESHKLRNHQNLWFDVVSRITSTADRVYATTGTVFGKNPEEMWSQFRLVDGGETFGENLGLFRSAFFLLNSGPFKNEWTFNKRTQSELTRMMQHRSIRYDESEIDELELPKKVKIVRKLDMAEEQREHYNRALDSLFAADNGEVAEMEAPWLRMRQISSGYLAWKDKHGDHIVYFKHNPKLLALESLLLDMGDSKIVICYDYTDTGRMIVEHVKKLGFKLEWLYGGTKDKSGTRRRFMEDPGTRVFVMNSAAGGTGNDGLQKVARYMVFFESPTPPEVRKQTEKRIHRPGQTERVFIYDLVLRNSPDQTILDQIAEGNDLHDAVVNGRKVKRSLLS